MVFSFSVCFTQKLVTRLYCVSNVRTRNTCTMCFCIQAKCGDLKAIIVKPSFSEKMWENREHKYSTTIVCQYITDIVQYFKGSSYPWKIYERFICELKETCCILPQKKSWRQYFYFYAVHDLSFWVVWIFSYLPISNCTVYPLFLSLNDLELLEPVVFQLAWSWSFVRVLFSRVPFFLMLIGDCFFPSHCTLTIPQCKGPTKWMKHHFSKRSAHEYTCVIFQMGHATYWHWFSW